jgi:hypothetical protein
MKWQEGEFKARPVFAALGKATTGTDQVEIAFAIYDEDSPVFERSAYIYLSPAAFDRSIAALRTCGWTGDDLSDLSSIGKDPDSSPFVQLVVKEEKYNGKDKVKIAFVNPWRERKPMDAAASKDFAEVMRAKVKEADARNTEKAGATGKTPF